MPPAYKVLLHFNNWTLFKFQKAKTVWSEIALDVFKRNKDKNRRDVYNYWRVKGISVRMDVLKILGKVNYMYHIKWLSV